MAESTEKPIITPQPKSNGNGALSFNKINIRYSHPNLYRSIMVFAVMDMSLGVNFLLANPTFNPYEIDKIVPAIIFFVLGFSKVIFLNFYRNLKVVRLLMTAAIIIMLFWGVGTTAPFFQGKASLQLFILYTGLSLSQVFLLLEPNVNPVSEEIKGGGLVSEEKKT